MENNQGPDQQTPPLVGASSSPGGGAPPTPPPPPWWASQPKRSSPVKRILLGLGTLLFILSIVMNVYLLILLAARLEDGFDKTTITPGEQGQTVAIYQVAGFIDSEAVQRFSRFHSEVKADENIKAVVLRVSSPGGGVAASDQIHHLVKDLADNGKTIVVSMGGMATSGGYYISAPAREIIAEPTTVTGSIGVLMVWPILSGTLDKLGIEMVVMKSTNAEGWKDETLGLAKPDSRQRRHLQELLDKLQSDFESVVRAGRGSRLKTRKVTIRIGDGETAKTVTETEPFNGKIYLPDEAKRLGLIDHVGYLSKAVDRAAALAGLVKPNVIRYEHRRGLLAELMKSQHGSALSLSTKSIDEFQTPRILLMWKAQ